MPSVRRSARWSRWTDALTRLPPTATPRAVAWSNGVSFLAGGVVVAASLLLPGPRPANVPVLLTLCGVCVAFGALYLSLGHRLPRALLHVTLVSATGMVTFATWSAAGGPLALVYPFVYVLVLANAFGLYSWLGSCAHLALVLAGALVGYHGLVSPSPVTLVVTTGVMVVACLQMGRLVRAAGAVEVDALTGLPNRRGLERRLDAELVRAGRTRQPLTLAMIDLDHFKEVNDLDGHAAGDRLLRFVARAWSLRLQDGAVLARWGGDEFVMIIPEAVAADAVRAVTHLRAAMPPGRSCTAGAATWVPGESASALTSRADAALYAAKRSRRGTTHTARDVELSPLDQLVHLGDPAEGQGRR